VRRFLASFFAGFSYDDAGWNRRSIRVEDCDTDLEGVREALRRRLVEPFAIGLADGRSLDVRHPERMAVGRRRIIVVEPDDSWSVIEPLLIVSLDCNGERSSTREEHQEDEGT